LLKKRVININVDLDMRNQTLNHAKTFKCYQLFMNKD